MRHQTIFREDEIIISSRDQSSDFAPEKKPGMTVSVIIGLLRPFPLSLSVVLPPIKSNVNYCYPLFIFSPQ